MAEVRVRDRPSTHDFRRGSIQFTLTTGGFAAAQESGSRREKILSFGATCSRVQRKSAGRVRDSAEAEICVNQGLPLDLAAKSTAARYAFSLGFECRVDAVARQEKREECWIPVAFAPPALVAGDGGRVLRFRRSHHFAAHSLANVEIKRSTGKPMILVWRFNLKFLKGLAAK
jgi:hypothetical protein